MGDALLCMVGVLTATWCGEVPGLLTIGLRIFAEQGMDQGAVHDAKLRWVGVPTVLAGPGTRPDAPIVGLLMVEKQCCQVSLGLLVAVTLV